jgi:hypothetical protein
MINRREMLIAISAAALGAAATSAPALAELLEPGLEGLQSSAPAGQAKHAVDDAADERLRNDLARLMPRANSEEGVPVFLACLNLVPDNHAHKVTSIRPTAFSTNVAAEFRQTAAAWERIRPNPTVADVAEVIVVLADRDFMQGGKEQTS